MLQNAVRPIRAAWLFALAVALPLRAQLRSPAAQPPARGATLQEAISTALARNTDVLTAEAVLDSARAEKSIASAYPNPVLAGQPNTPYQYAASIPLDITPRRTYRIRGAAQGIIAVDADRRDVRRQTTLTVARAFYDALLADQRRTLAVERRSAVLQVLQADSARYRSGDIPEHALARSEIELARSDADLERTGIDLAHSRIALQGLMGIEHPDTAFGAIGTLDYKPVEITEEALLATARAHRPDLQGAVQRVEQSNTAKRAAGALLFPTPEFSYVRQYTAPFESGHYYSLGLSFELPSINLYRGERRRAAAGAAAAQLTERRVGMQLERDVQLAVSDFRLQQSLVRRYQSGLLPKIQATVDAARYAYARGAASLLEVLDALRTQQDIRSEYAAALHDYWVSVHTLDAAGGVDTFTVQP